MLRYYLVQNLRYKVIYWITISQEIWDTEDKQLSTVGDG